MSAQWAVILLLSLLVVVNSVAVITLMRRASGQPADSTPTPRGPVPGSWLDIGTPVETVSEGADSVVFCFISPLCGNCRALLPTFAALSASKRVVLVSSAPQSAVRAYLAEQLIDLPLVTGPDVLDANAIPWPPYVVITTGQGIVLAQGGMARPEHLDPLLERATALGH